MQHLAPANMVIAAFFLNIISLRGEGKSEKYNKLFFRLIDNSSQNII